MSDQKTVVRRARVAAVASLPILACALLLAFADACSPAHKAEASVQRGSEDPRALDDVLRHFSDWTNPELTGTTQRENLDRLRGFEPELSSLFAPGAAVTLVVRGNREYLSPREFANRIAQAAFTTGPRQIILQQPTCQIIGDSAQAVTEQYLLDPNGPGESSVVRYELTIGPGAGRMQITALNAVVTLPTESQSRMAMQLLRERSPAE